MMKTKTTINMNKMMNHQNIINMVLIKAFDFLFNFLLLKYLNFLCFIHPWNVKMKVATDVTVKIKLF